MSSTGRPACPRRAPARSCAASCARLPPSARPRPAAAATRLLQASCTAAPPCAQLRPVLAGAPSVMHPMPLLAAPPPQHNASRATRAGSAKLPSEACAEHAGRVSCPPCACSLCQWGSPAPGQMRMLLRSQQQLRTSAPHSCAPAQGGGQHGGHVHAGRPGSGADAAVPARQVGACAARNVLPARQVGPRAARTHAHASEEGL